MGAGSPVLTKADTRASYGATSEEAPTIHHFFFSPGAVGRGPPPYVLGSSHLFRALSLTVVKGPTSVIDRARKR
ncbi:hypothetical protein BHE74_00048505 [Ensete ventricosum]|nr:hypothetical protein BHE74_00048505 [Ensete ventricosum]